MKRCLALMALLSLTPLAHAQYWPQNDPRSGGMRDLMLLYTTVKEHYTADDLMPYVAYLDKQQSGRPMDWFYDCYLFLTIGSSLSGARYDSEATNLADWQHFLDVTFAPDMNMHALDQAISRAAHTLGPPPKKVPVILMLPYPSPEQKSFGVVEAGGQSLDLSNTGDVTRVANWFVDEAARRFADGQFKNLSLWGFYWMKEVVPTSDEDSVKATARVVHDRKFGFHWIPCSVARVDNWRELGFDFVTLQPNYQLRPDEELRLPGTAAICRKYNLGLEIEADERTLHGRGQRENLYDYLNWGLPVYEGYMSAVHGYYQTIVDVGLMYASDLPADNRLYKNLYLFHKQTYREHPAPISSGVPCVISLPGLRSQGTLALTGETPAAPEDAVVIPGSGGSLTLSFPTDRRPRKVLLHARFEGARARALAFARVSMRDQSGNPSGLITSAMSPPDMATDPAARWWLVTGVPQAGRSMVIELSGPLGGRLVIDQVRVLPAMGPGLHARCSTDGVGDGQALTDREYAAGPQDAPKVVQWPSGKGVFTLDAPDDQYMGRLWLHAVKPADGQWPSRVEVAYRGRSIAVDLPDPGNGWASYFPVDLPVPPAGRVQVRIEGKTAHQPIALDEVELEVARSLVLGKPYTFDPPPQTGAKTANYSDDGRKLTDGHFAESFADGNLAGQMGGTPYLIADLGQVQPIEKVRIHAWGGGLAHTYFPTATIVSTSVDGVEWRPLLQPIVPPAEPAEPKAITKSWLEASLGTTSARYVKLDFVTHFFVLIDEIEVISNGVNIARSKPYRFVLKTPQAPGRYLDDGRKLTDGETSSGFLDHTKAVGSLTADPIVTVDLERPQQVSLASAHVCGGGWAGICYPTEVRVETSLDGQTWTPSAVTTEHPEEPTGPTNVLFPVPATKLRTVGLIEVPLDTTARFVRWHFKRRGYCLLDEVEVYGK
ncbi:MAG: DUF4855 domain-containing protein [Armatimonadota bacterium]